MLPSSITLARNKKGTDCYWNTAYRHPVPDDNIQLVSACTVEWHTQLTTCLPCLSLPAAASTLPLCDRLATQHHKHYKHVGQCCYNDVTDFTEWMAETGTLNILRHRPEENCHNRMTGGELLWEDANREVEPLNAIAHTWHVNDTMCMVGYLYQTISCWLYLCVQ